MAVDAPKKGRGYKPREDKTEVPSSDRTDAVADPDKNWADDPESDAYQEALKLYPQVVKAFDNKQEQNDACEEYWNIYNAKPDANQQYTGNTSGYIPAVRDAINARAKRSLKQLFPANNKHVEGLSSDGQAPYTQLSLLEHYIRTTNLRAIVRSDLIAGDVTGQWNLMVDWTKASRNITKLVRRNPIVEQIDGESIEDLEIEDPTEDEETTEEETVVEEGPEIIDFATEDIAVIPPTCNDLQRAKAVAIRLRMTKQRMEEMIDEGVFVLPAGKELDEYLETNDPSRDKKNREKKQANEAGVKTEGTNKYALIYMVYTRHTLDDKDKKSEAIDYLFGPEEVLGIIKNPLWSGKRPIISQPVDRLKGSFFGKSKVEPVKFLQWNLTDFWNMGQDSAMYSLLPIWRADPVQVPNWASLVMGLAAVWPGPKDSIEPFTQPQLWKDAAAVCDTLKRQIWESLEVNEMMMGRMPAGRKNNQLMGSMQQEQSVNINDHATQYEDRMLNPLIEMLFEFDQQYRTEEVAIEQLGEIGEKASIQQIPVPQWSERYFFRWCGTEYMNGIQRLQQQIAWMNVLKGIPPQMLGGLTLNIAPILQSGTENIFGPEMAPRILVDKRNQFALDPDVENEILHNGMPVEVHEADDDPKHLQSHMRAASLASDPMGLFKMHMQAHAMQLQKKREMAMAQQMQQKGVPGGPGGAGPGVAGTPRPGAMPGPPRPGGQQPPGGVPQDQMMDGSVGPRG